MTPAEALTKDITVPGFNTVIKRVKVEKDGDVKKEYRCTGTTSSGARCRNRGEYTGKKKRCYAHQLTCNNIIINLNNSNMAFKMKGSPYKKRGLWDNIHAKRKRIKAGSGETMRKPGDKGAPTAENLKNSQNKK